MTKQQLRIHSWKLSYASRFLPLRGGRCWDSSGVSETTISNCAIAGFFYIAAYLALLLSRDVLMPSPSQLNNNVTSSPVLLARPARLHFSVAPKSCHFFKTFVLGNETELQGAIYFFFQVAQERVSLALWLLLMAVQCQTPNLGKKKKKNKFSPLPPSLLWYKRNNTLFRIISHTPLSSSLTIKQLDFFSREPSLFHDRACMLSHLTLCHPMDCHPPGSSSMEFSRQEYWGGLPCPPPGDLPDPRSNPNLLRLLHWQEGSLSLVPPGSPLLSITSYRIWQQLCLTFWGYLLGNLLQWLQKLFTKFTA